ncbi:uncharacterized protein LOC117176431 [Belonocnema kinseyi]|uniref:uncharacterized protein LOC117176431 n=1 Tax=Belonocnema kinseyi TaxID=2817044 RepID=UPI00143D20C6|nr:uncharacterized protein LOC117176431 [Belonocnema kinseyi]
MSDRELAETILRYQQLRVRTPMTLHNTDPHPRSLASQELRQAQQHLLLQRFRNENRIMRHRQEGSSSSTTTHAGDDPIHPRGVSSIRGMSEQEATINFQQPNTPRPDRNSPQVNPPGELPNNIQERIHNSMQENAIRTSRAARRAAANHRRYNPTQARYPEGTILQRPSTQRTVGIFLISTDENTGNQSGMFYTPHSVIRGFPLPMSPALSDVVFLNGSPHDVSIGGYVFRPYASSTRH